MRLYTSVCIILYPPTGLDRKFRVGWFLFMFLFTPWNDTPSSHPYLLQSTRLTVHLGDEQPETSFMATYSETMIIGKVTNSPRTPHGVLVFASPPLLSDCTSPNLLWTLLYSSCRSAFVPPFDLAFPSVLPLVQTPTTRHWRGTIIGKTM